MMYLVRIIIISLVYSRGIYDLVKLCTSSFLNSCNQIKLIKNRFHLKISACRGENKHVVPVKKFGKDADRIREPCLKCNQTSTTFDFYSLSFKHSPGSETMKITTRN